MRRIRKNKVDVYYRKAKEQGWRSKCAFKLLEIDEKFDIFKEVTRAVDLCAAPGSWSQVMSRKLYMGENIVLRNKTCMFYNEIALYDRLGVQEKPQFNKNESVKIVAVDLHPMSYLPGVTQIKGDITKNSVVQEIIGHFEGDLANLVVCDGAPEDTGLISMDIYLQAKLLVSALHIACNVLKPGGTFVAKIFQEKDNSLLKNQLLSLFKEVHLIKPSSSRDTIIESFVVCQHYSPQEGFDPKLMRPFLDSSNKDFSSLCGINRVIIPFIVCGDVNYSESDITYPLQLEGEGAYKYKPRLLSTTALACSSKNSLTKEDLEHYLKDMDEGVKQMDLRRKDADEVSEDECFKVGPSTVSTSEEEETYFGKDEISEMENVLDNGPYFNLIQKTTGLKNPTATKPGGESVQTDSDLQFLYEDEDTDPELIRECIERMKISSEQSTCNCTFYE